MNANPYSDSVKPKILIVDDNAFNLIVLKRVLAKIDAEVIAAENGNDALSLTLDHDFSLILLDVQMPDMDGFEVASFLSGSERTCGIPIIFLTAAFKDNQNRIKGYEFGAVDYLEKPINETVLLAKVRIFLELRKKEELQHLMSRLEQANRDLCIEIERRRESEEASRRLANTVFAEASEGIMVIDAEHNVVAVNAAFSKMTDYAPSDIVGQPCTLLNSGGYDREFIDEMWAQLHQSGHWRDEISGHRKNGELFPAWFSASAAHHPDGSIANFVFFITDISHRKN